MNNTTGETKVGRRWNPVAKHDHNKGGAHKDRKKDAKKVNLLYMTVLLFNN